jgi:hypothetical protein
MPAAKTLDAHVRDGTFRARRHRELLAGPVVEWSTLALLQSRYVATGHELERRAIGVEFERAVRSLNDDHDAHAARKMEEAEFEAIVHAAPVELDLDQLAADLDRNIEGQFAVRGASSAFRHPL